MGRNKGFVFISGSTGLLGSQIALRALQGGCGLRLLVRAKNWQSATQRMEGVWASLDATDLIRENGSRIEVIEGDVEEPQFGLNPNEYQRATKQVSRFFHCAGYVDFTDTSNERFQKANVQATWNAIQFAKDASATLQHMSTAYISRRRKDTAWEGGLVPDKEIRNPYESSKRRGEMLVREYCQSKSIPFVVYRPSILLGSAKNGSARSFYNFYLFLRTLRVISRDAAKLHENLRMFLNPEYFLNLIPVDYAAEVIWKISGLSTSTGRTFHVCNPSASTFNALRLVLQRMYGLELSFANDDDINLSRNETLIKGLIERFSDYVNGEPHFSLANTLGQIPDYVEKFPRMDLEYFQSLLCYAEKQNWGKLFWKQAKARPQPLPFDYPQKYFNDFLNDKLNRLLVDNLRNLDSVFQIKLKDNVEANRTIRIEKGCLTSISRNGLKPECVYVTDCKTFQEIASARRSPQDAFFDRSIEVEGDLEKGLKVATALTEFFSTYPYIVAKTVTDAGGSEQWTNAAANILKS